MLAERGVERSKKFTNYPFIPPHLAGGRSGNRLAPMYIFRSRFATRTQPFVQPKTTAFLILWRTARFDGHSFRMGTTAGRGLGLDTVEQWLLH